MRKLVATPKFRRAYKKLIRRDRALQNRLDETLRQMQKDVFAPMLGTHKLSGTLLGLWASACGYDCRIIFSLETDAETQSEIILLHDIGSHDDVY